MNHRIVLLLLYLVILTTNINAGDIGLGNLAEIFSQLAGGGGCVFKCPSGQILFSTIIKF